MTTTAPFRVLAVLAFSLALAACGGSSGGSAASSEAAGATSQSATVTIDDLTYMPADVTVVAGSQVTWSNDDDAPHTVTFDDDSVESSQELKTGDEFSTTFAEAGTYPYVCAIHPDMKATVTVQ